MWRLVRRARSLIGRAFSPLRTACKQIPEDSPTNKRHSFGDLSHALSVASSSVIRSFV
jgi:hypothetical protein